MPNYRMLLQYDGTRYAGWQKQGNTENTLQGKLEVLLSRLCEESVEVAGAGRTDAGLHAAGQVAHFHLKTCWNAEELRKSIQRYLPEDVAILCLEEAPERFHSRLNAKGKTYVYRIWNTDIPNVFERRFMTQIIPPLDVDSMRLAASQLTGTQDYRAFCSLKRYKKSTVRMIHRLDIEQHGQEIRIVACGDGFLYHMVRILAGTLIEVGLGSKDPWDMRCILESRNREEAGYTAPPQGLILHSIRYETPIFRAKA